MLINGIKATNYVKTDTSLAMSLVCTVDDALAMDTAVIKVTTDQGNLVEKFIGYEKLSATVNAATKEVTLNCLKDDGGILHTLSTAIENNDEQHQELMLAVAELGTLVATISAKGANIG